MKWIWSFKISLLLLSIENLGYFSLAIDSEDENAISKDKFKIEGRVVRPESSTVPDQEWFGNTHVYTSSGQLGFLRENGSFVINNVPAGSHVLQVMNPTFLFESARIEITVKGKIRARVVNHIQPSKVELVSYPLRLNSLGSLRYFHQREQWRVTDFLLNPMVLMTILPLLLMMIVPRLGDAETRKEMEQMQIPKMETPELSEIMTNIFGGSAPAAPANNQKQSIKARPGRRKEK
ncbi:UNVERIFIED_CONTAM: hypothetical protein RMT77_009430 [Armadillidium vulgare]